MRGKTPLSLPLILLSSLLLANCASWFGAGQSGSEQETPDIPSAGYDPDFDQDNPTRNAPPLDYELNMSWPTSVLMEETELKIGTIRRSFYANPPRDPQLP